MYAAKQKASPNQPSSPAVNFFRHFPTSFLRPYGRADPAPTEDVVMRRLSSINCEWLRRPQTGVSKFAETIEANLDFLTQNHSKFTKRSNFTALTERLGDFLAILRKLNTKNSDEGQASAEELKEFLKMMLTNDDSLDQLFHQMMEFGGAMYLLGSHYTAIKTLLNDPQQYAAKSLETFCPAFTDFKSNPTVKGMKTLLTKTCCATTAPAPTGRGAKRNLAAFLDSDESDDEATTSTTRLVRPTLPPTLTPTTASTSGLATKKKARKNKKNH